MTAPAAHPGTGFQSIKLADGRRLGWAEYGDPAGVPVVYCHGLPGSRLEAALADGAAARAGLRLIAPDRPGCGRSSPRPGADPAHWVGDLEQLLDALAIQRALLLGVSGGGPFAIAAGVALGERIDGCALVATFASLDEVVRLRPRHFVAGLVHALRRWPRLTRGSLRAVAAPLVAALPGAALRLLRRACRGANREALGDRRVRAGLARSLREALRQRGAGAIAELERAAASAAVEPRRLRVPVTVWHGDGDALVPVEAGRRLCAAIPGARLRLVAGAGHYSLPLTAIDAILVDLRASAQA